MQRMKILEICRETKICGETKNRKFAEKSVSQKGRCYHLCLRSPPNVSVCIIDQPPLADSIERLVLQCVPIAEHQEETVSKMDPMVKLIWTKQDLCK